MSGDVTRAMRDLADAIQRTSFALLDYVTNSTPDELRPPVSWEVERERFLRNLPGYAEDPRDD